MATAWRLFYRDGFRAIGIDTLLAEAGVANFEVVGFYGFLAPAGTPRDVVTKLSDAFRQVLTTPDIRNRMVTQGADPAFLPADEFARFLSAEMPRWQAAVKASGARLD